MTECRVCLETGNLKDLISPCACMGTSGVIHRACLDQVRTQVDRKDAFDRCLECGTPFVFEHDRSRCASAKGWCVFIALMVRDMIIVGALFSMCFVLLGFALMGIDRAAAFCVPSCQPKNTRNQCVSCPPIEALVFPYAADPTGMYMVAGIVAFFAIMGSVFSCVAACSGGTPLRAASPQNTYRSDYGDAREYHGHYDRSSYHRNDDCCIIIDTGPSNVSCGDDNDGECMTVVFVILIVLVVIFAVIGAVVGIVYGGMFAMSICERRYVHFVLRSQLGIWRVKDLAGARAFPVALA